MLSLPLSVVGALGLLAITGRTLSIFAMIGMIMLMGLVTKNAILLVDYTNLLRSRGMSKHEALMTAGPVRLRPILMTAFSTIAGMLPVAIGLGSGAETRAPMGTAIVGGMVTSTILTLVVIPVMYSTMDDLAGFAGRWMPGWKHRDAGTPPLPEPLDSDGGGQRPQRVVVAGVDGGDGETDEGETDDVETVAMKHQEDTVQIDRGKQRGAVPVDSDGVLRDR